MNKTIFLIFALLLNFSCSLRAIPYSEALELARQLPLNKFNQLTLGLCHYNRIIQGEDQLDESEILYLGKEHAESYIIKYLKKYPRITEFDSLIFSILLEKPCLSKENLEVSLSALHPVDLGHMVLAVEDHQKITYKSSRKGGLDDYVMSLSQKEKIQKIIEFGQKCPEIFFDGVILEVYQNYMNKKTTLRGGPLEYYMELSLPELLVIYQQNKFWFERRHPNSKFHDEKYFTTLYISHYYGREEYNTILDDLRMEVKDLIIYFDDFRTESGAFEETNNIYHGGFRVYISSQSDEKLAEYACALATRVRNFNIDAVLDSIVNMLQESNHAKLVDFIESLTLYEINRVFVKKGLLEGLADREHDTCGLENLTKSS